MYRFFTGDFLRFLGVAETERFFETGIGGSCGTCEAICSWDVKLRRLPQVLCKSGREVKSWSSSFNQNLPDDGVNLLLLCGFHLSCSLLGFPLKFNLLEKFLSTSSVITFLASRSSSTTLFRLLFPISSASTLKKTQLNPKQTKVRLCQLDS